MARLSTATGAATCAARSSASAATRVVEVEACIASGDVVRLLALPRSEVPALAVALYRTPDNRFAAMQAFEYAELEYRPLTGLRIVGA